MRTLLIDIGNTRIKWALLENGELAQQQAAVHSAWTATECDAAFAALSPPSRVLVSNVHGDGIGTLVRDVSVSRWGVEPEMIQSSASAARVRNAYPEVWKLGVDRWVAIIGAFAMYRGSVCVASIGTAATIDGVDASGQHLGGLIIPGPALMVDSLLKNTAGIARRAETGRVGTGLFADNTLGAIRQGALNAVAALIERSYASMRDDLDLTPHLVLTGGGAEEVAAALSFPHTVAPDLVLRGLAELAKIS